MSYSFATLFLAVVLYRLFTITVSDLLAVPELSFGAMENWGLVVYRELVLLYDPTVDPPALLQLVAGGLAHELAHQVSTKFLNFYNRPKMMQPRITLKKEV